MPGGIVELSNRTDFPLSTGIVGTEVIPAMKADGTPVAFSASQFQQVGSSVNLAFNHWAGTGGLSTVTGTVFAQKAEVFDDTGTHTDVLTGTTVPNAGVYSWSISPVGWVWISASASTENTSELSQLNTALTGEINAREALQTSSQANGFNPAHVTLNGPIIVDLTGSVGGSPAVYIPLFVDVKFGASAFSGSVTNAASAARPDYCTFALDQTHASYIIFDFTSNTYKQILNATPEGTYTNYIVILATFFDGYYSPFKVIEGNEPVVAPNFPFVVTNATALVPGFIYFPSTNVPFTFTPPNNAIYQEVTLGQDVESTTNYKTVLIDETAIDAGQFPLKLNSFPTNSLYHAPNTHDLIRIFQGSVKSDYPVADIVPNEFLGAGFVGGPIAPYLFNATKPTTVTSPILTSLGFSLAYSAADGQCFAGQPFTGNNNNGFRFFRVCIQSDQDNNYGNGNPQLFFTTGNPSTNNYVMDLHLESWLSARESRWCGWVNMAGRGSPEGFIIGTFSAAGRDIRITGIQVGWGPSSMIFVDRSDYPAAPPNPGIILASGDMFLVQGRTQRVRAFNMLSTPGDHDDYAFGMQIDAANLGDPSMVFDGGKTFDVTATHSYVSGVHVMRQKKGNPEQRYTLNFTTHTAPATITANRTIAYIGDSITNRGQPAAHKAKLQAIGMNPTYVGTVQTAPQTGAGTAANGGGPLAEAREGRAFADYTNAYATPVNGPLLVPVPIGQEAAYLAASKATQTTFNPFIVPSTGANSRNGYEFIYSQYMTRFGIAAADDVIIMLGTNDIFFGGAAAQANIIDGVNIIGGSVRSALPNARIAFGMYRQSRTRLADQGDARYCNCIASMIGAVKGRNDSKMFVLDTWSRISLDSGWVIDQTIAVNNQTGSGTGTVDDAAHFNGSNLSQVTELTAAFSACGAAGV